MSTGAITAIVIIAIVVVAAAAAVALTQGRRARMRRQFGPEYDRMAKELGPKKAAAELAARQQRVEALGIHPLPTEKQTSYRNEWTTVQEQFVDTPAEAVTAAGTLVWDVMRDRGYPADDRNASMEALSVYHARQLDGYRKARDVRTDTASTEELREALIRYRAIFDDLLGTPNGRQPVLRTGRLQRDASTDHDELTARDSDRTADTPR
jgi:hypothetical protein